METVACDLCGSGRYQVALHQRDLLFGPSEDGQEFTIV
jgi:hypothetical protein